MVRAMFQATTVIDVTFFRMDWCTFHVTWCCISQIVNGSVPRWIVLLKACLKVTICVGVVTWVPRFVIPYEDYLLHPQADFSSSLFALITSILMCLSVQAHVDACMFSPLNADGVHSRVCALLFLLLDHALRLFFLMA